MFVCCTGGHRSIYIRFYSLCFLFIDDEPALLLLLESLSSLCFLLGAPFVDDEEEDEDGFVVVVLLLGDHVSCDDKLSVLVGVIVSGSAVDNMEPKKCNIKLRICTILDALNTCANC